MIHHFKWGPCMIVIFIFSMKSKPSQYLVSCSWFFAGNRRVGVCGVDDWTGKVFQKRKLRCALFLLDDLAAIERKEICLFSGVAGREEFESWRARVRPINRNIEISLKEIIIDQFILVFSNSWNMYMCHCHCCPPRYLVNVSIPCTPPNSFWMSDTCSRI